MYHLSFYKKVINNRIHWYASVPFHSEAENEMVAGSDIFLERIDALTGNTGNVTISFGLKVRSTDTLIQLDLINHNQWGGTYLIKGSLAKELGLENTKLWICNVTHDVIGEHPKQIFITKLS